MRQHSMFLQPCKPQSNKCRWFILIKCLFIKLQRRISLISCLATYFVFVSNSEGPLLVLLPSVPVIQKLSLQTMVVLTYNRLVIGFPVSRVGHSGHLWFNVLLCTYLFYPLDICSTCPLASEIVSRLQKAWRLLMVKTVSWGNIFSIFSVQTNPLRGICPYWAFCNWIILRYKRLDEPLILLVWGKIFICNKSP